jgi:hypothetical protein
VGGREFLEAGKLSVTRLLKVTADGLTFGAPKNQASRCSTQTLQLA